MWVVEIVQWVNEGANGAFIIHIICVSVCTLATSRSLHSIRFRCWMFGSEWNLTDVKDIGWSFSFVQAIPVDTT